MSSVNNDRNPSPWWIIVFTALMTIATIIASVIAVLQYIELKKTRLERDDALIEARDAELKYQRELHKEKDRMRIFEGLYWDRLHSMKSAVEDYNNIKRPELIQEYGYEKWNNLKNEKFREVQEQVNTFQVFIRKWRDTFDNIRNLLNGEIDKLKVANSIGDESNIMENIKILNENYDSDMILIEEELEKALAK